MLGEGRKSSSPIYLTTEGNEDCSCKGECDLPIFAILHLKNFFKSYLFWGGRERIPGRLCAARAEPHVGLDPMNREIMTCTQIKSQMLNQLSPQVPLQYRIFILFSCVTPNSRACQVKDRFLVPLSLVCPRWVSEDGRSPISHRQLHGMCQQRGGLSFPHFASMWVEPAPPFPLR